MNKKPILIVEDDPAIRETLAEILGAEGYTILVAENGERALYQFATEPSIALILLDLSMPIMDGHRFLAEFSVRHPSRKDLPILIMTAAGRHEIPSHPPELVLRKPMDVDTLVETIHRHTHETKS